MNNVTLDGNPIELSGKFPETGDNAPPFTLTNSGLEEAHRTVRTRLSTSRCRDLSHRAVDAVVRPSAALVLSRRTQAA